MTINVEMRKVLGSTWFHLYSLILAYGLFPFNHLTKSIKFLLRVGSPPEMFIVDTFREVYLSPRLLVQFYI